MDTTHHTFPKAARAHAKREQRRLLSGAMGRKDQDVHGHRRLGPTSHDREMVGPGPATARYGEFGTVGSSMVKPACIGT